MDDLRVLGLCETAERLGVEPFEVVRLAVLSGDVPAALRFSEDDLGRLTDVAGLAWWWDAGATRPEDANPKRALLRAFAAQLLERGCVGARTTRIDNLWRGLRGDELELVRQATSLLLREGLLRAKPSAEGMQVSVVSHGVASLDAFVNGEGGPSSIMGLWT
jgi:hypothetical protein